MKKAFVFCLIVLCSFAAFADKTTVTTKMAPYALEIATSSTEKDLVHSDYGFGGGFTFKRVFNTKGYFAEAGLFCDLYSMAESTTSTPTTVNALVFLGFGRYTPISDTLKVSGHIGVGADTFIIPATAAEDGEAIVSENITLLSGFEFAFEQSKNIQATLGCDLTVGFAQYQPEEEGATTTYYVNYRIIPTIGMTLGL